MAVELKVAYIFSSELLEGTNRLPKVKGRASYVHSLIEAYGLVNDKNLSIVKPQRATMKDLMRFHSKNYIQCLQKADEAASDDDDEGTGAEDDDECMDEHGIGYDCPPFVQIYDSISMVAGGSISAAEVLNKGEHGVAINWCGGWHHCHRDEAAGFCYVNDIVLSILKLKEKFNKILYVDLDLHHGDGVQEAFFHTDSVFTVSFHKFASGFFPGTGSEHEKGKGRGRNFCLNVPFLDGINDKLFAGVVKTVLKEVLANFQPDCVVCQCGADGLAGDPMNIFNLTQYGMGACVHFLLSQKKPLMLLGGGGYNFVNVAKLWTYFTALALGTNIRKDIPDHQFFTKYGPEYSIEVMPLRYRVNKNSMIYLKELATTIKDNLKSMVKVHHDN